MSLYDHPQQFMLALSPIDGRYGQSFDSLRLIFSEFGLIRARVRVEFAWLQALARDPRIQECPSFSPEQLDWMTQLLKNFSVEDALQVKQLESITNHDVKAVEYWIREALQKQGGFDKQIEWIHFACTSEDINNVAYALMLQEARSLIILPLWNKLHDVLAQRANEWANIPMMARTHGQAATPTTLGKECANIAYRVSRQLKQLESQAILAKMNGAVGNFNAHCTAFPDVDWPSFSKQIIEDDLNLTYNPYTIQIEPHDAIAEYASILTRMHTILLDASRDFWGYIALGYFRQKMKSNEVGSSTMPHKVNPIDFENAEGNFGLSNAIFQHFMEKLPISRWQRDLSDSTVLRNLGVALAHGILACQSFEKGLLKLEVNTSCIQYDLERHWVLLAEPIQTLMRKANIPMAYEQLKEMTRGQDVDQQSIHSFINQLPLDEGDKRALLALTPSDYSGYAVSLAKGYGT